MTPDILADTPPVAVQKALSGLEVLKGKSDDDLARWAVFILLKLKEQGYDLYAFEWVERLCNQHNQRNEGIDDLCTCSHIRDEHVSYCTQVDDGGACECLTFTKQLEKIK